MVRLEDAEAVAKQMASGSQNLEIQITQTLFRMQLVEAWQIPQGAKILEIGCGQGDMTAVLAHAVGENGHITAVDNASPDYGSPLTLGQSAEHLKNTSLGQRISFHFQYDVMDEAHTFSANEFDYVVLAHCSWYFESLEQLRRLLLRVRSWSRRLCYSEWDMEPQTMDQVAHLLAILIQGQIEAYKVRSESNVRTPFSKARFRQLLQEIGWRVSTEAVLDSSSLQDARWEIDLCLNSALPEADSLRMPAKLREFLSSQADTLRQIAAKDAKRSLPSYAIVAKRVSGTLL